MVAQLVKNLPALQCMRPSSDPREDTLETHSGTLTWKISWMEEPGGLQSMGSLRVRHD